MSLLRGFRFGSKEKSKTPEKQSRGSSSSRTDSDKRVRERKTVERSDTFTMKYSDSEEPEIISPTNYNTYTRRKGKS